MPTKQQQQRPAPPPPPRQPFTGEVDRRGRPLYDNQGNKLPRPRRAQRTAEWWYDHAVKPRARRRAKSRARKGGAKASTSRWNDALAAHRSALGYTPPAKRRRKRRLPVRRSRAMGALTLLAGTLVITAAVLELVSVAMAAELGLAAEGLGLATLYITTEPDPPRAPPTRQRSGAGAGGYVKGGTCGSTATKDKTPCGNPVAQGQKSCYLHGGANPNGAGTSTPAAKAKGAGGASNPPAKRPRKAKPAPPATGSMPRQAP